MKLTKLAGAIALTIVSSSYAATDEHTYANLNDVTTSHLHLDLKVDFRLSADQAFITSVYDPNSICEYVVKNISEKFVENIFSRFD